MEMTTLHRALLFDTYGDMLTEKQRLCFDLRYNQDLSLGEIGELEGISRQAVRDNIVRSEAQLLEMEEKIGAVKRQLVMEEAEVILREAAEDAKKLGEPGALIAGKILRVLAQVEE